MRKCTRASIDAPQLTTRCTAWLTRTMPPATVLREMLVPGGRG